MTRSASPRRSSIWKAECSSGARWQRICTEFHRVHAGTCARCIESDTILANQLNEGQLFSLYQCRNGLTDAASPVVIDGRHVANVFIGQFFLEPPDRESFRRQAREFGFEEGDYLEAVARVPVVPKEKLPVVLKYLTTCANSWRKRAWSGSRARPTKRISCGGRRN